MTERTFRTPSPGRPATSDGTSRAPPVPEIPRDIPPVPQLKERRAQRAASEDVQSRRQRESTAVSPALAAAAISTRNNAPEPLQRIDSRNSINFSYPRPQSPPPQSPPASPISPQQRNASNGITPAEANFVQFKVTKASEQPVKKKKKKVAPGAAEGSHLSAGSLASRPIVTPLEPGPEIPPEPQQQPSVKKKKKKIAATGENSHFPASDTDGSDQALDLTPEQQRRAQRASGVLLKQPSVVREDWEGEQEGNDAKTDARAREAQGLSPVASPAAAIQSKKVAAANMSRKIEEPASPSPQPAEPATYHAVTEPAVPASVGLLKVEEAQMTRQPSISPSRSTRFSDTLASDLATGRKHDPLPRSVSPVKSALKHHSPSPVGRARGMSPSEASDSNHSADGSVKRKKSARVSFEPQAEVVGTAAEPVETESPVVVSPQDGQAKKGGFFSFGRSRPALTTIPSDDDLDEHMKPRPQLPSFGSVRNKNRRVDSSESVETTPISTPEKHLTTPVTQTSSTSSDSSSPNIPAVDRGMSNDHAVGAIFAQHADQKPALAQDPNLPLPPVVTSREGGYISDTESNYSDDLTPTPAAQWTAFHSANAPTTAHEASVAKDAAAEKAAIPTMPDQAPQVAIQPPTPGHDESKPSDQWLVEVPGGFPSAFEEPPKSVNGASAAQPTPVTTPEVKRTFGPSEAELARSKAAAMPQEEEEDVSDNDSIYSDAAEEPEGDGFGSINAIVESPIVPSPVHQSPPGSPLADKPSQRPSEPGRTTSWDETQERWKGIAQQTRQIQTAPPQKASQQLQEVTNTKPAPSAPKIAKPRAPVQSAATPAAPAAKPKAKKKTGAAAIGAAVAAIPASQRPQPTQAKPQHMMKSSMRQGGPGLDTGHSASHMRTSMRQAEQPHPKSLQASKWATEPTRPKSTTQPQAAALPAASSRAALQKKHIPTAASASTPNLVSRPAPPAASNDSDSDSSFKRARKTRSNDRSHSMRRSMRESAAAPQPTGRAAVRSLSPPVRRPFSPAGDNRTMRTSMRTSMDAPAPTLRQQPQQKRSSSLFSMRKAKSPERSAPLPLTSKIRSRIGDSDDEDGPRPTTFRSRFADSSDEEDEPQPLRPVRGIPRRQDDGDSTDLEDSSDDERKKKRQLQPAIKIDTAAAQKVAPATDVPLSPNTMKKRGLFGRFRSKNKKDEPAQAQRNGGPPAPSTVATANAARPESKDDDTPFDSNMGFGSSAERDAMIKQTMAKLEAAKNIEPATPPPKARLEPITEVARPQSPTGSGKLQRRRPERVMSDSWPLPESPATPNSDRPATAGASPALGRHKVNGVSTMRPPNERRPTSETFATDGGSPVVGSKGKKKRFPMLRKAFGLKD